MIIPVIIVSFLLLVVTMFCYIIILKYFKKYTRERFAFFSVSILVGLISSFLIQIYSSTGIISAVIQTANILFKFNLASYETDFKDHIITFGLISLFMWLIFNLYKNWNGPISGIMYDKKRYHERLSIIEESYLQLLDFFKKEKKIQPHIEKEKPGYFSIFSSAEDDKTPWHESVYELLTYSPSRYKIDLQNDYYNEEKVFISKYGQNNEHIAILICIDKPDDVVLNKFITFCKYQKIQFAKYIVAVKHDSGDSRKIKWDGIEIIYRNENEMLNSLIDLSSYYQYIKDQFTLKEVTLGTDFTLENIYVELKAKTDDNTNIPEIERYVDAWLELKNDNKHLAILGEYGCGKSVLALKITYELLKKRTTNTNLRIPILIELRGKSPRNLNVGEILAMWATNYRLDSLALLKLHKSGKLLIIFEGFDEMDMIGDREIRLYHFQRLWEFAIPNSKIIVTGRPNFFLDDKELKSNLGIDKSYENSHYCEAIYLEKFSKLQIKQALRNIDENTRTQVIDILNKSDNSNFFDLVSRPAILFLIAVIWKERKLSVIKDKINSAVVISEFIQYSYSRQSLKSVVFPLFEKEREYFMYGVAIGMMRISRYSNQLSKDDLESIILKLYKGFPDEITQPKSAIQPQRKPLKERMIDNNQDEETILTDVRSCGILVNDLTRKDYFKFAHKSFLEYLVSRYFVESLLQNKSDENIMMNAISNALEITNNSIKHTLETITFTAEILLSKMELDKNESKKVICKKLFRVISKNKLLSKHPRIAAKFDLITASRYSYVFPFAILAGVLSYFDPDSRQYSNFIKSIIIAISIPMIALITIALKKSLDLIETSKDKFIHRNSIWLNCCKQLNIPETVIIDVVPKNYILYLNGEYRDPMQKIARKILDTCKKRRTTREEG